MLRVLESGFLAGLLLFGAVPSSSNYQLKTYDIGNGGGSGSSSNYQVNGITNGETGSSANSSNYTAGPGLIRSSDASVPTAPTFTNPSNYYDRLRVIVNTANNPSDTKYVIAISTNNFVTTNYVQNDNTVGSTLGTEDRQTYAAWGGASGFLIVGLTPNTTYQLKVKAMQGAFTESAYSPTSSAATVSPSITFGLATTLTATPPFTVGFGVIPSGSVTNAGADITVSLTTNAVFGGSVYVADQYTGLRSASNSFTLASANGDLDSLAAGYGAQVISAGQSSGGPFAAVAPFNGSANNIGGLANSLRQILATSSAVTTGTSTIRLKARTQPTTPAASDYTDTITFVAGMDY